MSHEEPELPQDSTASPRRPSVIALANQCARWVAIRALIRRPYLIFVPMHRIRGLARRVFWVLIDKREAEPPVEQQAAEWLERRSDVSRWTTLLLRWSLRVIIRLVSKWFQTHHPERYV